MNIEGDGDAAVVMVRGLSRRFGATLALDRVDLDVPAGSVVGIVGENGAGKTTLIKHILGLLRAEEGSVSVFGRDPAREPVSVLSRLGYLSEEPELPGWMRVHELLRYVAAFYPSWDHARLTVRFERELASPPPLAGALRWAGSGREWSVVIAGDETSCRERITGAGGSIVERAGLSFDEIFLAHSAP